MTDTTDITPLPFTGERIADATGGTLSQSPEKFVFRGVSTDSRTVKKDDLFIAIKGISHDAHDFIPDVLEKGIRGIAVEERQLEALKPYLKNRDDVLAVWVKDTLKALGALASSQRKEADVKLVAITGSNGKTTTRAMVSCVLEQKFKVLSTRGNFNNEIGLPLTLLRLGKGHEWAAAEMGMNAPGEIARLSAIAAPDVGIITNVSEAHVEGLGSLKNIARAKAELVDFLAPEKTAILNLDDPMYPELIRNCRCRIVTFGTSEKADIRAEKIQAYDRSVHFILKTENISIPVTLNTPGIFMVNNALAAAGAGVMAGLNSDLIKNGLEAFVPVEGRMNILESKGGFHVIDDTYNANPCSMAAAIDTLKELAGSSPAIAVLGDMKELGVLSDELHRKTGAYAAAKQLDAIFTFGDKARLIGDEAIKRGFDRKSVFTGSKKEIIETLLKKLGHWNMNAWILVKGSRSMAMEEIVKDLIEVNGDR